MRWAGIFVEGIADGFVPGILARHRDLIDEIVSVDSAAAISEMRRLAREFGLLGRAEFRSTSSRPVSCERGTPSWSTWWTFFCDEGEKYINDYFLDG